MNAHHAMNNNPPQPKNWFDQGGQAYAKFRPDYPAEIVTYFTSLLPATRLAVDVGCGTGQLTRLLAPFFDRVIGLDPSADQILNAAQTERVTYQCAPAEHLPLEDKSANLITAAQAAHWFDLPKFFDEVRRVASKNSLLALISYGVLKLEPSLNDRFQCFYTNQINDYWPPERKLVDSGYATIDFPFPELAAPPMEIRVAWSFSDFLGYLSTWSAVRHAREVGRHDVLQNFANDMAKVWGDPSIKHAISWPIHMRIGRL